MERSVKSGFSLVEILIVVVIVGILAAVLAPQFTGTGESARYMSTVDTLKGLRSEIELYRNQHHGHWPGVTGADPDIVFAEQMTLPTNAAGERSKAANQGFGDPNYPLGPYLPNVVPPNLFNSSRRVRTVAKFPSSPSGGGSVRDVGWIYEITSGRIRINYDGICPAGQNYWEL